MPTIMRANPAVAIVGATGAVGVAMLECLHRRNFPLSTLRLLASPRSAGTFLPFGDQSIKVDLLKEDSFEGVDIALFSAGKSVALQYAPMAVKAGALVVDNSSAFRMDPDVPLVVPEVNGSDLSWHHGLVANPNCVAAIMTMVLAPLQRRRPVRHVWAATYQAASGAGAAAMAELRASTDACLRGESFVPSVLPHPYAFNLFSHNSDIDLDTGHNGEELKVIAESRRILGLPALPIGITCIRVPVLRAHAIAMTVVFDAPVSAEEARTLFASAPGIRVVDDAKGNHFPMPAEASGQDDILVGRIRIDLGDTTGHSLSLFVAGDQLLKGAALNAVQIAERCMQDITMR